MTLTPKASRLVWVWWCGLHLLLVAATALVAWPAAAKLAALAVVAAHGAVRRPRPAPASIEVAEDATCLVPAWRMGRVRLGPRTLVCAHWIRLDLGKRAPRSDILLFVDQLDPGEWARLRAVLGRARCDTPHVLPGPREPI